MMRRSQPTTAMVAGTPLPPSSAQMPQAPPFHLAAWRGEIRIVGMTAFAIPALAAISLIGFAALLRARSVSPDFVNSLLVATLEAFLPLAAATVLTTVASKDDALEVQLSLATAYRKTVGRRVALLLSWIMAVGSVATLTTHVLFPSALPKSGFDLILLWLAPTLWLSAAGIVLALLLRSRATAMALLGVIWIVQLAFHGYFISFDWTRPWFLFATLSAPSAPYWRLNRLELIVTAAVCLIASSIYLRNNEWRFRGEDVSA